METIEISKEVNIHLISTQKFKSTIICILIRRPLCREDVTINALIPNILQRGCSKYDTMEKINNYVENLYGSVFETNIIKKGEQQFIQFYMEFAKRDDENELFSALDFLKEVMLFPLKENGCFKEKYVEQEKENLRLMIEGRENNKGEYAKQKLVSEMAKGEPFGLYGDGYIEDLKGLNSENICKHYEKILKESPIDFVIIGDEAKENVVSIIKDLFQIEREEIIQIGECGLKYEPKEPKKIEEEVGLKQGKICIGLRTGIPPVGQDFYNLLLINEILGGGANSKLFSVIREKESLCYYVSSFIYRFKTIMLIQSGVDSQNFEKYIELVHEQIDRMKNGDISDDEFENGKLCLIKKFVGIKDYPSATVDFYISQFLLKDRDDVDNVIEKISSISKKNISKIAKEIGEKLYIDTIYMLR